jgi:hypothetical protein
MLANGSGCEPLRSLSAIASLLNAIGSRTNALFRHLWLGRVRKMLIAELRVDQCTRPVGASDGLRSDGDTHAWRFEALRLLSQGLLR